MHWVNRGSAPQRLTAIRNRYTTGWVQRYPNGSGSGPSDNKWLEFKDELRDIFLGLCAYCEEITSGEVDHFRPKSKCPSLVYCWDNWLFSCHECNHSKSNKWPRLGYVDPCAVSPAKRPEVYFVYATDTGYMTANSALDKDQYDIAKKTIKYLGLNDGHHLDNRAAFVKLFSAALPTDPSAITERDRRLIRQFASRAGQCSSVLRAWLAENGFGVEADW